MDNRCNKCGHISEAHPDGGACYNVGCSCTRLETYKNIELENLIVQYNGLLEKSDRQREQVAMLEQSRADIRLENKRLLGCMDSYNQELVESMTEIERLKKELALVQDHFEVTKKINIGLNNENNQLKNSVDVEYQKGYEDGLEEGYSNGVGSCQG